MLPRSSIETYIHVLALPPPPRKDGQPNFQAGKTTVAIPKRQTRQRQGGGQLPTGGGLPFPGEGRGEGGKVRNLEIVATY